ncbi:hypothetical protein OQJ20_04070 [Legionella pneumophila]|uniref:hypothetical protein n=2 Tax=Legionella pneumophila TaxID=446 RepID=UPI002243E966|nr:hypothetical protein [Legionella pneumophila]MCW8466713.1 hypothetical protein [Legionella pneumophila]MCW8488001.1 hypothetical protein [Legionella pneumophila]
MKPCMVSFEFMFNMKISQAKSYKILFVVQRLSDFVEMKRASIGLKQFGYQCHILFCGVDSTNHDLIVLKEIEKSIKQGEIDGVEIPHKELSIVTEILSNKILRKKRGTTVSANSQKSTKKKSDWIKKLYKIFGCRRVKTKIKKIMVLLSFTYTRFFIRTCLKRISLCKVYRYYSSKYHYYRAKYYQYIDQFKQIKLMGYQYKSKYFQFVEIIKSGQYKLIVLPEDIVGKVTPLIIKSGHTLKIPSLILPYTIANQSEAFQALKDRDEFQVNYDTCNKLFGIFFRSWVMKDDNRKVLRLPAGHVYGHIITGTSPPDPWMMNSGYANIIAIENEKMFEYYRNSGIPASKMKITGACYDDNLAYYYLNKEYERKKLYRELGIQSDKPLFLLGGFPNQITANPPRFDFEDAEDAVDFIVDCVEVFKKDYEIIFRPHPNYLELSDLFTKKNILVTQIDTTRLVALSDIYLAFASATIRWAISCGIPTINYDMFYYDFSDYKNVQGVLNACTKEEFKLAINTMNQPEHFIAIKKQLDTEKRKWGNLDGKSTHRINELVRDLIHLKKVPRKAY